MAVQPAIGFGRPFARADLALTPRDGRRYELVDGTLIVTPAPGRRHRRAVGRLAEALHAACPPELTVVVGPVPVGFGEHTELRPDIVVRSAEADPATAPVLAVEVMDRRTWPFDHEVKRAVLERERLPGFWAVDSELPRIEAWEPGSDGRYVLTVDATGDDEFVAVRPYPVRLRPAELVRDDVGHE
jgi:Uma2 family endonuclease